MILNYFGLYARGELSVDDLDNTDFFKICEQYKYVPIPSECQVYNYYEANNIMLHHRTVPPPPLVHSERRDVVSAFFYCDLHYLAGRDGVLIICLNKCD